MTVQIPLTKGFAAIVDDDDADWVNQWKWNFCPNNPRNPSSGYARRCGPPDENGKRPRIFMHRELVRRWGLDMTGFPQVDHINLNPLDNRRENLRPITVAGNRQNRRLLAHNKTGIQGVCWDKCTQRWVATISAEGRHRWLGRFQSAAEAKAAYDAAAREFHPYRMSAEVVS